MFKIRSTLCKKNNEMEEKEGEEKQVLLLGLKLSSTTTTPIHTVIKEPNNVTNWMSSQGTHLKRPIFVRLSCELLRNCFFGETSEIRVI